MFGSIYRSMAGSGSMIRYRITALMRYQYGGVSKNVDRICDG
jgi:hypothetical protein